MTNKNVYSGTGRRKQSVARVNLIPGKGNITVNGKPVDEYLPYQTLILDLKQPLEAVGMADKFDVEAKASGGGFSGQTGAIRLAIARALLSYDTNAGASENSYRKTLKAAGFVTRDARIKERKKYGLKKARRAPQFSKR